MHKPAQMIGTEIAEVGIEIVALRAEPDDFDAGFRSALGQTRERVIAGSVVIPRDIEPAQTGGKQQCAEMRRRERGDERKRGEGAAQRKRRLDALPGDSDIAASTKAYAMAEQKAHGAPIHDRWRRAGIGARMKPRMKPSAMHASDDAGAVCDARDHGGEALFRRILVRPIEAARMKTERALVTRRKHDAARAQIGVSQSAAKGTCGREETLRGFRRALWRGLLWCAWRRIRAR